MGPPIFRAALRTCAKTAEEGLRPVICARIEAPIPLSDWDSQSFLRVCLLCSLVCLSPTVPYKVSNVSVFCAHLRIVHADAAQEGFTDQYTAQQILTFAYLHTRV